MYCLAELLENTKYNLIRILMHAVIVFQFDPTIGLIDIEINTDKIKFMIISKNQNF